MRTRRAAVSLLALVLAAACSGRADGPSEAQPSPDVLPGSDAGDRLLVLMDDGSVVTARPDGGGVTALARSGGVDVEIRHPVWSPDGRSVAWAELVIGDAGVRSSLVVVDPSGADRTEFPVETGTFFLQWDPTSSRIAYLGSYRGSIAIGVAERGEDGAPVATTLGVGQPFFLSWSPEGDRMLIHVGDSTLGTLDLSGELESLGDTMPGIFQAPVWLPDGRMVYASTADERQHLVVREAGRPTDLVAFDGAIEFVVSPDGERVAYRVSDGSGLGGISVVEFGSARSRVVTDVATSAFHWSPDGRHLLLMTQE
jgi:Tol biopolymer transport system component